MFTTSSNPDRMIGANDAQPLVNITLIGLFAVRIGEADLTPRGAKTRALLGLLALTPELRRSRRWIETKLWSDRSARQASGSLRQCLAEIRRSFGPHTHLINSDREYVWLDPAGIRIDVVHDPDIALARLRSGRELLEGLVVHDEEFESWLRVERSSFWDAALATQCHADKPLGSQCTLIIRCDRNLEKLDPVTTEICSELLRRVLGADVNVRFEVQASAPQFPLHRATTVVRSAERISPES